MFLTSKVGIKFGTNFTSCSKNSNNSRICIRFQDVSASSKNDTQNMEIYYVNSNFLGISSIYELQGSVYN